MFVFLLVPALCSHAAAVAYKAEALRRLREDGSQGRIQDFKLGGAHLKKLRRAEGGAKIFGVFRVKNHDFMPKNRIFPILGGSRKFLGYFM